MRKIIGVTLGSLVLVLATTFIAWRAMGGTIQIADETSGGWTYKKTFEQTRSSMPAGTRLYWLGPSSSGFRLDHVKLAFRGDPERHGAEILYRTDTHAIVLVNTYVGLDRPPQNSDQVPQTGRPIVGRVVTGTDQLVLLSTYPGHSPSPADVRRLERDLRPVTAAEIAALPEDWPPAP